MFTTLDNEIKALSCMLIAIELYESDIHWIIRLLMLILFCLKLLKKLSLAFNDGGNY